MFRVLQVEQWRICNQAAPDCGDFFTLEVLNCFDPPGQVPRGEDPNLINLAASYDADARLMCAKAFLQFAQVSGTLCGWIGSQQFSEFSNRDFITIMNRYIDRNWGTSDSFRSSQLRDLFSVPSMC